MKNDPQYVKYLVRFYGRRNGKNFEQQLPFHKCTDEDWDLFPPASKDSFDAWTEIKDDPNRGMFCIDWDGERVIYGNERNENNLRMDIVFVPCNYLH